MGTADSSNATIERAQELLQLLALEAIELDLFRGDNERHGPPRLFGGQVLAQGLRAACLTVPQDREPHSLHGYFLRPGNPQRPVLYEVDRIRDGRSFTTRRIVAIQDGRAIFNMTVSLQIREDGLEHAQAMPNVPPPTELENDQLAAAAQDQSNPRLSTMAARPRPFETRSVIEPWAATDRLFNPVWVRFGTEFDASDWSLPYCLLAYASDMGLVSTAAMAHTTTLPRSRLQLASLDHSLWIHRRPDLTDWLLFAKRTTTATGARGLNHAEFYNPAGSLLASVSQEGLLRQQRAS